MPFDTFSAEIGITKNKETFIYNVYKKCTRKQNKH